jgi:hypothetical protein
MIARWAAVVDSGDQSAQRVKTQITNINYYMNLRTMGTAYV